MSASPNQLDEIYRLIQEHFVAHPVISIRPTKGDPPDQYEITYTITGMSKTGEGKIVESIDHTVELAIPFGFPHFPPSCKPKSDIFHPDFDPAAICLGDFWEQDRSLSDLIIHIGKMINGEIYSTTNAFNEEAAEWYLDNSGKFPFARINWEIHSGSKSTASGRAHEIDTLDDADLTAEFDFLALEEAGEDEDIILNTSFPEVDFSNKIDLKPFSLLENQKKYYSLLNTAKSITQPTDELTKLCQKAKDEISKVEKLHSDGKKFENRGEAQIALEKYQQITATVADFPNIDSDIHRIKQTLSLLADITPTKTPDFSETRTTTEQDTSVANEKKSSKKSPSQITKKEKPTKTPIPNDLFLPKNHQKSRVPLYALLCLTVIGIGYIGYLWYSFTDKLSNAEAAYAQCSTSHANNQFEDAKRSCDKALRLVGEVKFIHQDFARQLEKFILEILQSEKLTKGLAGYVMLDGKYIPIAETKAILSIKQHLSEAETLFAEGKWQPAMNLYEIVLAQAENNSYLDREVIEEIKRKRLTAEFRMSYDPAQVSIQKKEWEEAIEKLLRAQEILVSLPEADRGQYSQQLQRDLQKSQFANLKEQGDQSFTGTDWLSAIAAYNLALASGQKTALPPESIDAIRNNIKRAELYNTINKGNKAFATGSWDEAIAAYSKASSLLIGNKATPKQAESDANIQKLGRIILQASIIRDRQIIQALLEKDDLAKVRDTYQQIITNIAKSSFSTEQEFATTKTEISTALQELDERIALTKKTEYLKKNYQTLFIANYPTALPENLSNPLIVKSKETDAKLIFKMQCTENDGGRPLTLVMFYAYDKKTGKWSFYSEK